MYDPPFHEISGEPVSLYIHVPFCLRKCHYCAFHSVKAEAGDVDKWLVDIKEQIKFIRQAAGEIVLDTIYIGGGTPTVIGEAEWREIEGILKDNFDRAPGVEFSVEANPETLKNFHIGIWKSMGVTRVSLGVQSLNDGELIFLGRNHTAGDAIAAVKKLKKHFDVSADLIFGLNGQTLRSWNYSIRALLDEGLKHLSLYQLTIEPKTRFAENCPELPDGYKFYRFAQWLLPKKGLRQYEIASFAESGHECRHNLSYWYQKNVIAVGAASSGYINGLRYTRVPAPGSYKTEKIETERLDKERAGIEAAILALRTSWGINKKIYSEKYGEKLLEKIISELKKIPGSCLNFSGGNVSLTGRGMRVANEIWSRLM
ncbi:MAG: radical SAM family heme chaperone HemW [Synergistaceae bacterium]|nr:radical SAM family heme chaperone HemW [Synergistaceae bacterium]